MKDNNLKEVIEFIHWIIGDGCWGLKNGYSYNDEDVLSGKTTSVDVIYELNSGDADFDEATIDIEKATISGYITEKYWGGSSVENFVMSILEFKERYNNGR